MIIVIITIEKSDIFFTVDFFGNLGVLKLKQRKPSQFKHR